MVTLQEVRQAVTEDLSAVDSLILEQLSSDVVLINQLGHYIVGGGGKRLRPLVLLLSARTCGYEGDHAIKMSAVIEFIHTATLLHDDVVDDSEQRRGKNTSNAIWGNEASILVGDFLYSRAFQLMVQCDSLKIMKIMADTTNTIAEGEVLQLISSFDPDVTESRYREVIYRKTAVLFESAAKVGAVLNNSSEETESLLCLFGHKIGNAFQIQDDILDYVGDPKELGKNLGDDLASGKLTLPLIFVLEHGNENQKALVREAVKKGQIEQLDALTQAVKESGAIEYCEQKAREEVDVALSALTQLPKNQYRDALETLARFSIERAS